MTITNTLFIVVYDRFIQFYLLSPNSGGFKSAKVKTKKHLKHRLASEQTFTQQ